MKTKRHIAVSIGCWIALVLGIAVLALVVSVLWPDSDDLTNRARKGDIKGVKVCLLLGVDINEPSRWGWRHDIPGETPLTAAAQHGQLEMVGFLLDRGARIDQKESGGDGDTALIQSVYSGDVSVVKFLHQRGADLTANGASFTALHLASALGHLEIMNYLLDAGVPVNIPSLRQKSPLYSAARAGNREAVVLLISRGAWDLMSPPDRKDLVRLIESMLGQKKADYDRYAKKNSWPEEEYQKGVTALQKILELLED